MTLPHHEPWMSVVAVRVADGVPVLRYCTRCWGLVYPCPDPACCPAWHHWDDAPDCTEDVDASQVFVVPLSAEQIERYQRAEHERRLRFHGCDPFWKE
jgi:hypothetical protein